ncbi:MAG: AAA family ATPase [Vulcanibacillus sp.]
MVKNILLGAIIALTIFMIFLGLELAPIFFGLLILGVVYYLLINRKGGLTAKNSDIGKNNKASSNQNISFEDIGGLQRVKQELTESLDFLKYHKEYSQYGIRPIKGILLDGPPGTGKTLLAKAAANYTDSVFIATSGSEFVEMYVGVGAQRVRQLFNDARALARKNKKDTAIVFIDEIEVIGGKRDNKSMREYDQTLNQLLTEMDGIKSDAKPKIFVMAATNRKDMLDSALIRPGRFDRNITVDLPDKTARKSILEIHTAKKPYSKEVDFDQIAQETYGFSGAQLESVANEAAIYAFRKKEKIITNEHFSKAIDKILMGEQIDKEASKTEKKRVAIHELGHAFVAEKVKPGSVSQIVLRPRGKALGYVRHNPEEDIYLHTRELIEEQIMIALGGSVAEEVFYGCRSTGSKNDFEQALNLVNYMLEAGLTSLGIVNANNISKKKIEEESQLILSELLLKTRSLIEPNKLVIEGVLGYIEKEESISGQMFRVMINNLSEIK